MLAWAEIWEKMLHELSPFTLYSFLYLSLGASMREHGAHFVNILGGLGWN